MRQGLSKLIKKRENMCDYSIDVYYYSNACHVCRAYGNNVQLKRCASCKMIAYCSREHQRKHWRCHKDLCRIFTEIVQQAGTVFGARDERENSMDSWTRAKTNLILLIQMKLGRKLLPYETEMLQFPRSCEICHDTNPQKLVDCSKCPFVSFCHDHPRNDNEHAEKCEISRLCFEIDTAQDLLSEPIFERERNENIPKSMDDVVGLYSTTYDPDLRVESSKFWSAYISEYLTRPYTFLWAVQRLNEPKLAYTTIHVIGANAIEIKSIAYWEILLHCQESLKELRIVLIGPELEQNSYEMEICEGCSTKNLKIFVESVDELYADYVASKRFEKPNYIVGFNLGIHECQSLDKDTWPSSVVELSKQDCPFFMTSYTLQECREERDRMNLLLDNHMEFFYSGKNPFSSLRPYRDFESEDFFYQNQYLTIYEKLC